MNPTYPSSPDHQTLTAAVLSVEPAGNGRALVTFRTTISPSNPSGRESAHTPLLSTPEGEAVAEKLRSRISHQPVRPRNTTLGLTFEANGGPLLRVISQVR